MYLLPRIRIRKEFIWLNRNDAHCCWKLLYTKHLYKVYFNRNRLNSSLLLECTYISFQRRERKLLFENKGELSFLLNYQYFSLFIPIFIVRDYSISYNYNQAINQELKGTATQ